MQLTVYEPLLGFLPVRCERVDVARARAGSPHISAREASRGDVTAYPSA